MVTQNRFDFVRIACASANYLLKEPVPHEGNSSSLRLNIDGFFYATVLVHLQLHSLLAAFYSVFTVKFYGQAERAISNGQLHVLLHFHIRPINVVVYHGPS